MLAYLIANIVISFGLFDYCLDSDVRGKYYHPRINIETFNINSDNMELLPSRIEVCTNASKEEIRFYALHELWHFFWFEFLNDEDKKIYEMFYNYSNNFDFYREYSKKSVEEDFADNFTLAIDSQLENNIINWRILKLKINFIKHLLLKYEQIYKN